MYSKKNVFLFGLKGILSYPFSFLIWAFNKNKVKTRYIAHRGYSDKAPDSTKLAFDLAIEETFYGIETDIRFTKDGKIILSHDGYSYFNGEKMYVNEHTYQELTRVKMDNGHYMTGFEEYLTICKKGNKVPIIELKEDLNKEDCKYILDEINKYHDIYKVTIISFFMNPLLLIREIDSKVNLEFLVNAFRKDQVEDALNNNLNVDAHYTALTFKNIKKMHKNNLTVNTWTINSKIVKHYVKFRNVDFITSNKYYK